MPAVGFETLRYIFAKSQAGEAFDRDVIVVVEIDKFAEFEMTRKRGGFGRNAFHQIAVRNNCIDVMIDNVAAILVELGSEVSGTHRHANTIGKPLAQRTCCYLDTWRQSVFRMAGSLRAPLTKTLQLLHRKVIASQIEQRVEQHRSVSG